MKRKWIVFILLTAYLTLTVIQDRLFFQVSDTTQEIDTSDEIMNKNLKDIGYIDYAEKDKNIKKTGVVYLDKRQGYLGWNLFTPFLDNKALLIDMEGNIIHEWNSPIPSGWEHVETDKKGNLYVVPGPIKNKILVKLDSRSNIIWSRKGAYHHDITVLDDGKSYAIRYDKKPLQSLAKFDINIERIKRLAKKKKVIVLDDLIEVLTSDGKIIKTISLLDYLGPMINEGKLIASIKSKENDSENIFFDIFHTNTINLINQDTGYAKKGDILIASLSLNRIAILDIKNKEVVWTWGKGILERPHQPTILENGNILVFNNGAKRNYSSVLEIDPLTNKIIWEYYGKPKKSFYSESRSGAIELPNGNILITETNKGHIFEITRRGDIVWDYWNPIYNENGNRRLIYRMNRIPYDYFLDFKPRDVKKANFNINT